MFNNSNLMFSRWTFLSRFPLPDQISAVGAGGGHYCVDFVRFRVSLWPHVSISPIPVFPFSQYSSFTFLVSLERWIGITCVLNIFIYIFHHVAIHLVFLRCPAATCIGWESDIICLWKIENILKPVMYVKLKAILRSNTPCVFYTRMLRL